MTYLDSAIAKIEHCLQHNPPDYFEARLDEALEYLYEVREVIADEEDTLP